MTTRPSGAGRGATNSYSTGGGGTVLEHRYGAWILAHLLLGDAISELGDRVRLTHVTFQSADSEVDDIVVRGLSPDGEERTLAVGVRRDPLLTKGDEKSIKLIGTYLLDLERHRSVVEAGHRRFALAVAGPSNPARQLSELTTFARSAVSASEFRATVHAPGRTTSAVRGRLTHVDAIVEAAVENVGIDTSVVCEDELAWRFLRALRVRELRLEGGDESDRAAIMNRLRSIARDGTLEAASALYDRLVVLSGTYAPSGSTRTEQTLRGDLADIPLGRSSRWVTAWGVLDGLGASVRARTGVDLPDVGGGPLELARAGARADLITKLSDVARVSSAMVICGEPDVGKSALAMRAVDDLVAEGVAVTVVGLGDLAETVSGFESRLGGSLAEVLACGDSGRPRLLVVDGGEAVLHGRSDMLAQFAAAALRVGFGVCVVTRTDAAPEVSNTLKNALGRVEMPSKVVEHEVSRLDASEVEEVVGAYPALGRIIEQPRARWLLGRLGLVDLLVSADATQAMPDGALSEADVFDAVWSRGVRRNEVTANGVSPDERADALVALARRSLLSDTSAGTVPARALASLRSDGFLLAVNAWRGEEFASELVRDLATARLLVETGFGVLEQADNPRWALRAARVACQAVLARAGEDVEAERVRLQRTFDSLGVAHGARWAEVPVEAMLTLGTARSALAAAWPAWTAAERATVVRLALHGHGRDGVGDAVILAPVVELAWGLGGVDPAPAGRLGVAERKLVLAWLRGLVVEGTASVALRVLARDTLLDDDRSQVQDAFRVEALALTGADLDDHVEAMLRRLAGDRPDDLAPAVEAPLVPQSMAAHRPDLLLALAEAYYIDNIPAPFGTRWHDQGVRSHRFGGLGAHWSLGPFHCLLDVAPLQTLTMINRLLDHAVTQRITSSASRTTPPGPVSPPGLTLSVPGLEERRYSGDATVWSWYRGAAAGPWPCISALLAVERFADRLLELGVPLALVVQILLRDSRNLAMPGLVVGLLVRHIDQVTTELDHWLSNPHVWRLEMARITQGTWQVQGDDRDARGHLRGCSFHDVAHALVITAIENDDGPRLAALNTVADELLRHAAQSSSAEPHDDQELVAETLWAATLRRKNYSVVEANGRPAFLYQPPADEAAKVVDVHKALHRGGQALRLHLTYGREQDRSAPTNTLAEDLVIARDIAQDPPSHGTLNANDAPAAVAAAAIVAHSRGHHVREDDLVWAMDILVDAATPQTGRAYVGEWSVDSRGPERSAAAALPLLLLPAFTAVPIDTARLRDALVTCATSTFEEVRRVLAVGMGPVWSTACDGGSSRGEGAACGHEIAWHAVDAGLRDCRLGAWNRHTQSRDTDPLIGPVTGILPTVSAELLLPHRLNAPIVAASDAARGTTCVAARARALLPELLDAHRRAVAHHGDSSRGGWDQERRGVERVLLTTATEGDLRPLLEHVRAYLEQPPALVHLAHTLMCLFSREPHLRRHLPRVWPPVMGTVLDAIAAGATPHRDRQGADVLAALIPRPTMWTTAATDVPDPLAAARADWITPDALATLIERWLPLARGKTATVRALLAFIETTPSAWQATTGLTWIHTLVDGHHRRLANQVHELPDWLERMRTSPHIDTTAAARPERILDALAQHEDTRAMRIQRTTE
ncbi:hypothetical protein OG948_34195 (plasmid) [Embleya sp. NBC_00888]|uniref:hypothetical protein n=1 Tax=Embleya sp. NBC_00888 TaxID=2975960 RepID=UPI00386A58D3|nr:hypothetical protein OG948_34195 [Embleya sp. NBC_00888]